MNRPLHAPAPQPSPPPDPPEQSLSPADPKFCAEFRGDVDAEDLLLLLAVWGECQMTVPTEIPRTVEDCYNRFYPQDMDALIACIEAIE